ncbi:hypothetical protein [Streptomyces sp. KR55]
MSVPVSDQSRIERFYTDVPGFTELMDDQLGIRQETRDRHAGG